MPVALCVCMVAVFITPPNQAWAAGACAGQRQAARRRDLQTNVPVRATRQFDAPGYRPGGQRRYRHLRRHGRHGRGGRAGQRIRPVDRRRLADPHRQGVDRLRAHVPRRCIGAPRRIRQERTTYRQYRQQWPIHRPAPAFRVVEGWPFQPGPGGRPVVRVGQAEAARGSVCGPTDFRGGGLPDRSAHAWFGSAGVCPVASQGGRTVSGHYPAAAGRTIGGGERFPARCERPRVVDRRTGARPVHARHVGNMGQRC